MRSFEQTHRFDVQTHCSGRVPPRQQRSETLYKSGGKNLTELAAITKSYKLSNVARLSLERS